MADSDDAAREGAMGTLRMPQVLAKMAGLQSKHEEVGNLIALSGK
jgi:hypothetical protein